LTLFSICQMTSLRVLEVSYSLGGEAFSCSSTGVRSVVPGLAISHAVVAEDTHRSTYPEHTRFLYMQRSYA